MKKLKRILALLCLFLLICPTCLSFAAAEGLDTPVHEDPPVDLLYITRADCKLDIPGSSANITSFVKGTPGSTTKCEIDLSLQKWSQVSTYLTIQGDATFHADVDYTLHAYAHNP